MTSGPITSWQIDGETMETVRDFIFLGSKITADGDCSHEIKRCLLLGRKTMTNLDSIFKSRNITLLTNVCLVKAMVFPVVMYGCECWTIKKVESCRTDALELWFWRRLLRVSWTTKRTNQSILKEISTEYSLEGLMLNLKLQCFACQAPQSMEFSRQEYWSGLPFPCAGHLPNPGIEPGSPALQANSLPTEPPRKPKNTGVSSLSLLQGNS